jgi:glycine cleavage system P protein (glycine dehydrogenase)
MAADLSHPDTFSKRHIGPDAGDVEAMLKTVRAPSLDRLIEETVPRSIRLERPLEIAAPSNGESEFDLLEHARAIAAKNQIFKSFIGCGYSDCITPPVIQRNVLENPGWYTQYTPYQAEVAQGRLEALLNFQTMISDLTKLDVANASLLDEATAAAEAMTMLLRVHVKAPSKTFFVSEACHPQTIEVVETRARPLGIEVVTGDHRTFDFAKAKPYGILVQYPATDGTLFDYRGFIAEAHKEGALVVMAADLLALTLLVPPGELGADCAIGSAQRFGVPMGYGGPHAAYMSTKPEFVRSMPGRIIGVAEDAQGHAALRMALQTREQHIRREKATSNICTAQVLLAVMSSMYAVYHGPKGLRAIAERTQRLTALLARGLVALGHKVRNEHFFDTIVVEATRDRAQEIHRAAHGERVNLRAVDETTVGVSLDETTSAKDVALLLRIFAGTKTPPTVEALSKQEKDGARIPATLRRTSEYLAHPVFNLHHSETEMLRYMRMLESRDLSLAHSMIPLGSCTMKLNATAEMYPVTFPGFSRLHPFAPVDQAAGYQVVFKDLEAALVEITGFAAVSLQPNAGSQGEYAGLLVIDRYHRSRGQGHRNVCLIPSSAHGTNPASAVMAGYRVVVVQCDDSGNIDLPDLRSKAQQHSAELAALMVTYPSTHGVFEEEIKEICTILHQAGGQVYMDGANMNAQVGLCRPGDIGADVCHLNLHKTFCIPHGGGGPGMGPIGVAPHLAKFLPSHPIVKVGGPVGDAIGAVAAAPWGSASILLISWAYIQMMGARGLTEATKMAILNANYIAERLSAHYPILYRGKNGRIAHECILDMRAFKKSGIEVEDLAKRLMDYGFHAPTISFPVAGTMMIEPTESEPKEELDRFCDAMIMIREEIREVEEGRQPKDDNILKNAPHTARAATATEWRHPYSRERAAFPASWVLRHKFWPSVGRLNNVLGDRHLVCSCPPVEDYEK